MHKGDASARSERRLCASFRPLRMPRHVPKSCRSADGCYLPAFVRLDYVAWSKLPALLESREHSTMAISRAWVGGGNEWMHHFLAGENFAPAALSFGSMASISSRARRTSANSIAPDTTYRRVSFGSGSTLANLTNLPSAESSANQ